MDQLSWRDLWAILFLGFLAGLWTAALVLEAEVKKLEKRKK